MCVQEISTFLSAPRRASVWFTLFSSSSENLSHFSQELSTKFLAHFYVYNTQSSQGGSRVKNDLARRRKKRTASVWCILWKASTFLHNLYPLASIVGRQRWTLEDDCHVREFLWFTVRARSKRIDIAVVVVVVLLRLLLMFRIAMILSPSFGHFWYVEWVALTIAEIIGDSFAIAAIFTYFHFERLCLAPILL